MLILPLLLVLQAPWEPDALADPSAWKPRVDWVGGDAPSEWSLAPSDGALVASVNEKRMKWLRSLRCPPRELAPWLVLRYRASGLGGGEGEGDYALWCDAGGSAGRALLASRDLVADGAEHTVALDLEALGIAPFGQFALQAIAGNGPCKLTLTELRFAAEPPADATRIPPAAGPARDDLNLAVPPADSWSAHPDWLANPGTGEVSASEGGPRFTCRESGSGVKWSARLTEPVDLAVRRFLRVRYRAAGGGPSDYALCAMGEVAYTALLQSGEMVQDGAPHTVLVPLEPVAAKVPSTERLALQVQAHRPGAWMQLLELALTDLDRRESLAELLPVASGVSVGWRVLPLEGADSGELPALLRASGFEGGCPTGLRTLRGVPLVLSATPALSPVGERRVVPLPVERAGSELHLLVLAAMVGQDQPARGEGKLRRIPDADRFVLEVETADGRVVRHVPRLLAPTEEGEDAWGLRRGLCLLRVPLDPGGVTREVRLVPRSDQLGLALLAATLREGEPRHPTAEDAPAPRAPGATGDPAPPRGDCRVAREGVRLILETPEARAVLAITDGALRLESLLRLPEGLELLASAGQPLLTLRVDGREARPAWEPTAGGYRGEVEGLVCEVACAADPRFGPGWTARIVNTGGASRRVEVVGAEVRLRLPGERVTYCFPSAAAVVSGEDATLSAEYAGWGVRHQLLAASEAGSGLGVALLQTDRRPTERVLELQKQGDEVRLAVRFPERDLPAGATRELSPTWLAAYRGDWHVAFERYRAWLAEAQPTGPRPGWFRRVWNFRQRFFGWLDPLWPDRSLPPDLLPALEEADREFGGCEYLHLFDWGSTPELGRVYARPGDPDPADGWAGGYPALREAIESVRARGVHVGLYIEGYLLETRGPLGQRVGESVGMRDRAGAIVFWPDATEEYACAGSEEWRQIQEDTYRRAVANMLPDGMYVDQYGFCPSWRACYSTEHGHPVPSACAEDEAGMLRRLRLAIDSSRAGVAMYTEETPPDANMPLQDGSFTYSMQRWLGREDLPPLNLARFVVPGFKTIEILVCDKPTADWVSGVEASFFNGEALWLEGPAEEWFAPATREAIRKRHAVLRAHEDAFASDDVTPLVPTLAEGIFANRFASAGETVYTLWNARHATWEGPVLALPEGEGDRVVDLWNGDAPLTLGEGRSVSVRLEPLSVGCVVVRR